MPLQSPQSREATHWICCQVGAREHYAIPRALHQKNQLLSLFTDTWLAPNSIAHRLPNRFLAKLFERYHPDLHDATVHSFTSMAIAFEIQKAMQKKSGWELIVARDQWFQKQVIRRLNQLQFSVPTKPVVFTYSYAGLEILRCAKRKGWRTVLGQIDPGPIEEKLVAAEHESWRHLYRADWHPAPKIYWERWFQECDIADSIIVNSSWSKSALEAVGISKKKIHVIPLAYTPQESSEKALRSYPNAFSKSRPLKVLFLGQVILRKGIAHVLEAAKQLQEKPIQFFIVGSIGIERAPEVEALSNVVWLGSIPRSEVSKYYQLTDVFLFPTISDGFGLTQLEAQSHNLPIIASNKCGEVVKHRENGLILPEISCKMIVETLDRLLNSPEELTQLSHSSENSNHFGLEQLYDHLNQLNLCPHLTTQS
ncbi:MAG: glycosyltransferase family 4 protein [Cyanobacteria bacterium J06560_6]